MGNGRPARPPNPGSNAAGRFTPTQQKIIDILADGMPHLPLELMACMPDEIPSFSGLGMHISNMRKVLRPKGMYVLCELHKRKVHYRLVRLVVPMSQTE